MSARRPWSCARKQSSWAWSRCGKMACAASLTAIQQSKKSLSTHELKGSSMPKYNYVAMDAHGKETKGTLEVASQNDAIGRVKEMGLFPTKIVEIEKVKDKGEKKAGPAPKGKAKA